MPLSAGTRLGPYEILDAIGAGGMGEVYKARDTRLDRTVAIKVSKEQFSDRFQREAQAVAALNHPNICTLYDVGPNYLVMEFVEGAALRGPLPLAETLTVALQICDALEAAHAKGVVHRDLKPANIRITPEGKVKVLDFGLASLGQAVPGTDATNSPTLTIPGVIMGTAGYMSPEQARGSNVDKRADIWAFGVILYELLTGRQTFSGETVSDMLASVLKTDPDWSKLPAGTPASVRRLLRRCLQRDRRQRLADIADARLELNQADEPVTAAAPQPARSRLWIAAAVLLALATGVAGYFLRTSPEPSQARFEIHPPPTEVFSGPPVISPDGKNIVLRVLDTTQGRYALYLRRLDSVTLQRLPQTEGAFYPCWSPDSRHLAFVADDKVKTIDIQGGVPQTVCTHLGAPFLAWSPDNVILFGGAGGIMRVSASGGTPVPSTLWDKSRQETFHISPQFLPDGRHFLFHATSASRDKSAVMVGSLDSPPGALDCKVILHSSFSAIYARGPRGSGYLLFERSGSLVAQRFDTSSLHLSGEIFTIAPHVGSIGQPLSVSVSDNGVLGYSTVSARIIQFAWFNRSGAQLETIGQPGPYRGFSLSADEKRLAMEQRDAVGYESDIWVLDLARKGVFTRLTFNPGIDSNPVWTPDSSSIVFTSNRNGKLDLYQKAIGGAGGEHQIENLVGNAWDVSGDGRFLLYSKSMKLAVLPISADKQEKAKPIPLSQTEFRQQYGQFSPDGKWVAYTSDESKRDEVYVQSFPAGGNKIQISTNGGSQPRWRRDGKELFYLTPDNKLMAVAVKMGVGFEPGVPVPLFAIRNLRPRLVNFDYAVSADGRRFLMAIVPNQSASQPVIVVMNFLAGRP